MVLQTMITNVELPKMVCFKYFYFVLYTSIRAVIFTFFFLSIIMNDLHNSVRDLLMLPIEKHNDWETAKNFTGDTKNWI
jgi:hypothetical protein